MDYHVWIELASGARSEVAVTDTVSAAKDMLALWRGYVESDEGPFRELPSGTMLRLSAVVAIGFTEDVGRPASKTDIQQVQRWL
jgi:hypothetical protein